MRLPCLELVHLLASLLVLRPKLCMQQLSPMDSAHPRLPGIVRLLLLGVFKLLPLCLLLLLREVLQGDEFQVRWLDGLLIYHTHEFYLIFVVTLAPEDSPHLAFASFGWSWLGRALVGCGLLLLELELEPVADLVEFHRFLW